MRFDIASTQAIKQVQVCFAWAGEGGDARFSPNVRRLSAADGASTALNTVSFGAAVPDLREVNSQWWNRLLAGSANAVGLDTVPLANMVVTVTPTEGTPASLMRPVGITSVNGAVVLVLVLVAVFYVILRDLAAAAGRRSQGRVFGPLLWLVTGTDGYGSLSQFQIMLWTLTVAMSAVYVMCLSGNLLDIPNGMLQLLGVAGGAALLARVPPKDGLRDPATKRAPTAPAHWSDLVVIDGNIDVTRVQMLVFTLISAAFVVLKVIVGYQIAEIPENFVLLMGISNGVYLTGRHLPDIGDSPKRDGSNAGTGTVASTGTTAGSGGGLPLSTGKTSS